MVVYGTIGQALTIPVTIWDAEFGERISSATGLDSKISKEGAAFVDCTNELVEISSGVYIITLTTAECTGANYAALICSTTTSGAKIDTVEIFFSSGSSGGTGNTPIYWRY